MGHWILLLVTRDDYDLCVYVVCMYDCVNVCECHGRVPTDTTRSPPKGNHESSGEKERMVVVTHGRKNGSKMLMFDGWFGVWWKRSGRTGIEDFKKTHTHTHTLKR